VGKGASSGGHLAYNEKQMLRYLALSLWAVASFAQTAGKPPAYIDQALRARITEFYQDHVTGEFRKAEALVADDTKDYYYISNKPRYQSFEIVQVDYTDDFTRAKVITVCEQILMLPGFEGKPVKLRLPSTWKVKDGEWFWYVDQSSYPMPFGSATGGGVAHPGMPPGMPADLKVKLDKDSVTLAPGESVQVEITNSAPGPMRVLIQDRAPGVEVQLEHGDMKAGEKAVLTLKATPDAKPGVVSLRVEQTAEVLPVRVSVK